MSAPTPTQHPYDVSSDIQDLAFLELKKRLPKTAHTILDIGCGTGKNTATLNTNFRHATITGIDPKATMISHAKNTYKDINFSVKTLEDFNPSPSQFDLILSNATLHWCKDWDIVSKKLAELCCENGQILFSYFGPKTFQELNHCLKAISNEKWATAADNFTPYGDIEPYLKREFKGVDAYTLQITETHETVMDLLKKIKATEVNTHQKNKPFILGKTHVKALTDKYIDRYGSIVSTYDITIVNLKK